MARSCRKNKLIIANRTVPVQKRPITRESSTSDAYIVCTSKFLLYNHNIDIFQF